MTIILREKIAEMLHNRNTFLLSRPWCEQVADAILALFSLPSSPVGVWSPIESAPKDGTEILGFWQYMYPGDAHRTCGQQIIEWSNALNGSKGWFSRGEGLHADELFTHWQPLPIPPTNSADATGDV